MRAGGAERQGAVERGRADLAQLAAPAGGAAPDAVEHLLRAVEQAVVGAREAELEVAASAPLAPRPAPVQLALPT